MQPTIEEKEVVLKMAGVLIRTYVGGYIARGEDYYDKYAEHPYRTCCIRDAFNELLRRKQHGETNTTTTYHSR